ncbi:hypothetical protein glysoja_043990 [Glycine soja]|uniref:Uncharacterized protein n=1 Tax=Glycine soja TaxID=3848 RepID=A0A0B2R0F1_GLYSO|nr:hypothetical protein glysoja_043990 [Glycine soja]
MIILTIVLTCVSGSAGKKLAESIIKEKLAVANACSRSEAIPPEWAEAEQIS